jgi:hypothetical protein
MMQRKLDWLSPISDPPDSYGMVYVNMKFDDGTIAYKGAKPEEMVKHYADLLAISMTPELVEIELEDTGKKTQKGATKYKLVGYPGWSAPVAQGGKAQANANNGDREDAITRAVALKAAVRWASHDHPYVPFTTKEGMPVEPLTILSAADRFYAWLVRGEGQQDAEVPITERTTDPIPVPTSEGSRSSGTGAAGSPARNRASEETSASSGNHGEGAGSAVESEGVAVSSGGPRAATPKDENPWEGLDVL